MSIKSTRVVLFLGAVLDNPNSTRYQRACLLSDQYSTVVICRRFDAPAIRHRFVKIHTVTGLLSSVKVLFLLARLRWFGEYNTIYTHYTGRAILNGFIAKRLLRYRWIYDLWDHPYLEVAYSRGWKRWLRLLSYGLTLRCLRSANVWIISMQKGILDYLPSPSARTKIIHLTNGVAPDIIGEAPVDTTVPTWASVDKVRLCYLGSVRRSRGIDLLLDYITQIDTKDYPPIEVVICGGTDELAQHTIERFNTSMPGYVKWLGYLPHRESIAIATKSDACLCLLDERILNYDFAYPIKLFEYLAIGRPVIATRTAGIQEILGGNDAGLLIDNSVESLAEAIETIDKRKKSKRLDNMGAAGQALAKHYQWSRINAYLGERLACIMDGQTKRIL